MLNSEINFIISKNSQKLLHLTMPFIKMPIQSFARYEFMSHIAHLSIEKNDVFEK